MRQARWAAPSSTVKQSNMKTVSYDVRVHMEHGNYRTLRYATEPGYRAGDAHRTGKLAPG